MIWIVNLKSTSLAIVLKLRSIIIYLKTSQKIVKIINGNRQFRLRNSFFFFIFLEGTLTFFFYLYFLQTGIIYNFM